MSGYRRKNKGIVRTLGALAVAAAMAAGSTVLLISKQTPLLAAEAGPQDFQQGQVFFPENMKADFSGETQGTFPAPGVGLLAGGGFSPAAKQQMGMALAGANVGGIMHSASIKASEEEETAERKPVVVTAAQAKTYPATTTNNVTHPTCYPLPKGAKDYTVGEEIVYKNQKNTYRYYVLASGVRVASTDIAQTAEFEADNKISAMTVETKDGFTYVRLKMSQQVAYSFQYLSTGVSVKFHYTSSVPNGMALDSNPIFKSASWSGSTLTLSFIKENGFMGYKGYYDENGNLVLRFNNPPTSIKKARICIDPGHGGSDPGSKGFLPDYPERSINYYIAKELEAELTSRGATVYMLDSTAKGMSLANRVAQAEQWKADIFISVHNNSATNEKATGTETYFFYPFSRTLAIKASGLVAGQLNTNNRGARISYYHVTLSSEFASVLVECGFMSNQEEYEKLLKIKTHKSIAVGIADAAEYAIAAAKTGSSASGVQSVGGTVPAAGGEESPAENDNDDLRFGDPSGEQSGGQSSGEDIPQFRDKDSISLDKASLTLAPGETAALSAATVPSNAAVTWKSGNTSVATVDKNGVVTAYQEGKAKITAQLAGGESATCQVEVVAKEQPSQEEQSEPEAAGETKKPADASDVVFESNEVIVTIGKTKQLAIYSDVGDLAPADFNWESDHSDIVSVDANGVVTAKAAGSAEITAIAKDKSHSITCVVIVNS